MRFTSPTINLWFIPEEFIKFVGNLQHYIAEPIFEVESNYSYPVGRIDDINVYFMHYHSFAEAKMKWEERCKRIDLQNLYVIMPLSNNMPSSIVEEFNQLPYQHKIILTEKDYGGEKSTYHIAMDKSKTEIYDLCLYKNKFTGVRWLDDFDYVGFFNNYRI